MIVLIVCTKRLAKKKWDNQGNEENRSTGRLGVEQRWQRQKEKVYSALYLRQDSREEEKD